MHTSHYTTILAVIIWYMQAVFITQDAGNLPPSRRSIIGGMDMKATEMAPHTAPQSANTKPK